MTAKRSRLTWKFEDAPEDAPLDGSPEDVGPAWVDTYDGETHISSKRVRGGDWVTRAEAERLARRHGAEFFADDAAGGIGKPVNAAGPALTLQAEVEAINGRLRSLRIPQDNLKLEPLTNGDVFVIGSLVKFLSDEPEKQHGEFRFTTAARSEPPRVSREPFWLVSSFQSIGAARHPS